MKAPKGVKVASIASGLGQPTNVAFDSRGRIWVTSGGNAPAAADGVWLVPRPNAKPVHVVSRLNSALGLAWHRGRLYVSHVVPNRLGADVYKGRVTAFSGFDGRRFERRKVVVGGLPTGLHRVDSIAPGPDGRLYLGVGSQEDAARPTRRFSASVISFRPNGSGVRVEARGLRNPFGLAFVPGTSTLLVSDNGRDDLGLNRPPEELNAFDVRGPVPFFGFPRCFGQGGAACRGTRPPAAELPVHSAVGGVAVAEDFGRFGRSVFVAEFGSSFADKPTGGRVVRLPLNGSKVGSRPRPFLPGLGRQQPLGLGVAPDGSLYVTRWTRGDLLRVTAR